MAPRAAAMTLCHSRQSPDIRNLTGALISDISGQYSAITGTDTCLSVEGVMRRLVAPILVATLSAVSGGLLAQPAVAADGSPPTMSSLSVVGSDAATAGDSVTIATDATDDV